MKLIFSLITPTYNSHEDLKRLLLSLKQNKDELDQVEIIVVDDGSYDDTEMTVRSLMGDWGILKYYYQKNRGPAAARNFGAKNALGQYLIFVDEDCLVPKGCIQAIKDYYKQNPTFAGFGIKTVNSSKSIFTEYNQRLGDYLVEASRVSENSYGYVCSRCYSFSKDSFWAINGHDEGFVWAAEDRDFCLRIKEKNLQLSFLQTTAVINTDHIRFKSFMKQNFGYGFAAGTLTQKHPRMLSLGISRYKKMFIKIVKDDDWFMQFKLIVTLFLAQAFSIAGLIFYKMNFDYYDRPPTIFPPKYFIFRETVKNFMVGLPFVKWIKEHLGAVGSTQKDSSTAYLANFTLRTGSFYKDIISKASGSDNWLKGKKVLEIGPGSHLGGAIYFLAQGAQQVVSIDKAGEVKWGNKECQIYRQIRSRMPEGTQEKLLGLFDHLELNKTIGFEQSRPLNYLPRVPIDSQEIITGLPSSYFDLIVSYNTMEYIQDLNSAFKNMKQLLKQDGMAIHRVDAGSYYPVTRHCKNRLSQYLFSDRTWDRMFSHRHAPTRKLSSDYLNKAKDEGFPMVEYCIDEIVSEKEFNGIHKFLSDKFRQYSLEEIGKAGFVLLTRNI